MVQYQPPRDWQQWVQWLAAGLHGRSRWRLSLILLGMVFARGRRTVTTWLPAAGISAAGQQQVRNIWTNVAVFNLNLWVHTLVECWAWHKPADELCDRSESPWDNPDRRPSHADRRKALHRQTLHRQTLHNEYSSLSTTHRLSSQIHSLYERLLQLAV